MNERVKRNNPGATFCLVLFLGCVLSGEVQALCYVTPTTEPTSTQYAGAEWSDGSYRSALSHVDENGLVDYRALLNDRTHLDTFMRQADGLNRSVYEGWIEEEKIAFWVNVYNAATLQTIIDHYPIRASFFGRLVFPENSIRQIKGVWSELTFPIMGTPHTLDQIEHEILRRQFKEPRIHFALVCAAKSCPPLRNEPYEGARLDRQLDDQASRFLARPDAFKISVPERRIYLSKIFDWFAEDFSIAVTDSETFAEYGKPLRGVLEYLAPLLDDASRTLLRNRRYSVKYLDYDWTLNEQGNE